VIDPKVIIGWSGFHFKFRTSLLEVVSKWDCSRNSWIKLVLISNTDLKPLKLAIRSERRYSVDNMSSRM
jgi:hypothetical protein